MASPTSTNIQKVLGQSGTSIERLWALRAFLTDEPGSPATPAPAKPIPSSSDLTDGLQRVRDLFTARGQKIQQSLPDMHPANLPFGILGEISFSGLHETIHTHLLAWFIDPCKPHGFDTRLLAALLEACGHDTATPSDIHVATEHHVPGGVGRIDILVTGKLARSRPFSLWIEAKSKLDTQEGPNQLKRYEKARRHWRDSTGGQDVGIFLTPDGREVRSTDRDDLWKTLSYTSLGRVFWNAIKEDSGRKGFELMRLYLSSIFKDYAGIYPDRLHALDYQQIVDMEVSL